MDQLAQAARRLAGRAGFDPACRRGDFSSLLRVQTGPGVHSTSCKMSTGDSPRGQRRPRVGLATLLLPSAVTVYMWTLPSTPPRAFMASNGGTLT